MLLFTQFHICKWFKKKKSKSADNWLICVLFLVYLATILFAEITQCSVAGKLTNSELKQKWKESSEVLIQDTILASTWQN
jgi:hypothetical protein